MQVRQLLRCLLLVQHDQAHDLEVTSRLALAEAGARGIYVLGTNLREIEFTQCRVFFAVRRSPTNT
jgi:hypothetical protein